LDEHDPAVAVASECSKLERELNAANDRIKRLEAVTNDPHALWANWLRGSVTLPVGIGDVREYQERIKRLEEALRQIANQDYRGNRSTESQIAAEALKEAKL
jgi:predicted  nucleic acid-binding Zn-ribbon protein